MAQWIHTVEEGESLPPRLVRAYMLAVMGHIMTSGNRLPFISPYREPLDKAFWLVDGLL